MTGEPGIGKTALIDEFQRQVAAGAKVRIARGQCVEGYGGKEAYYPMLEALGQLCGGPEGNLIVDILEKQAPTLLVQFPAFITREHREMLRREITGATHERMLREICEALEAITSETPLLLVFEDLHWVDHSTIDLISALARRRQPARLMVLGTYRPADMKILSDHPLQAVKQELLIHDLCVEMALDPLAEADVAEYLVGDTGRTTVPEGLPQFILRRTEGNPLFIVITLKEHERKETHHPRRWRLSAYAPAAGNRTPSTRQSAADDRNPHRATERRRASSFRGSQRDRGFVLCRSQCP